MNIWKMLGNIIEVIGLTEVLLGKEVTTPDGVNLGVATDIKLDLIQDKIMVVIKHQGQLSLVPIEQIKGLTNPVILFEDCTSSVVAPSESAP